MTFEEVKALAEELGPLASFATTGSDGTPHVVPLLPRWEEETLVFGSRARSFKVRHLHANELCAVQFLTPGSAFPDALLLKGTAEVIDDDGARRAYWESGLFPFLPKMYAGPGDPELCFVRFTPLRASLVPDGGRSRPRSCRRTELTEA